MIRFVNITESDFLKKKLVYKHMSLENALKTLKTQSLWFSNPEKWKDPYEKRFLNAKYTSKGNEVSFLWKERLFCTCVTQTVSSEAYWNTYSHGDIGVEFRIDREVLLNELEKYSSKYKIFIGKVEYMKTKDIKKDELKKIPFDPPITDAVNTNEFAARLLLLKREAFHYEDEIRILLLKKNKSNGEGLALKYSCENTDLFKYILLDPNLKDYTYDVLKDVFISKYGFAQSRVFRSHLYDPTEVDTIKID